MKPEIKNKRITVVQLLRRFHRNERGAIAIIFALAIIPLMVLGGMAVDLSQAYLVKARLSHALDAAALAVGSMRSANPDSAYLETQFSNFVNANYASTDVGATHDLTFTDTSGIITVTGKATVDTVFMRIVGINNITVSASSQIIVETNGLELVMVLDNSGSMGSNGKMTDMKAAALELISIIFGTETTPTLLKVGLVPFDNTVNIGTGNLAYVNQTPGTFTTWASLADTPSTTNLATTTNTPGPSSLLTLASWSGSAGALSSLSGQNGYNQNSELILAGHSSSSSTWQGCVMARAYPADVEDSDIATAGKWEPFYNIYNSSNRNYKCPRPITPLTNNRATLEAEINAMSALGATHINLGAVWGWRVLSPTAPFTEGTSYSDPDWNKAAIILSDGDNTFFNNSSTYYSAYEPGDITPSQLDSRLSETCTNMKNEGIIVYTIAFGTSIGSSTAALLTSCASSADKYFESPDAATLSLAFRAIGAELKNLHLSQ